MFIRAGYNPELCFLHVNHVDHLVTQEQQKERLGQRLHEQERTTRERAAKDAKVSVSLHQVYQVCLLLTL